MSYEVILENLCYENKNPFHFLKYIYKYKTNSQQVKSLNNDEKVNIKFIKWNKQADKNYKNTKISELPLEYFKTEEMSNKIFQIDNKVLEEIKQISGIIAKDDINKTIEDLIPHYFIIQANFGLQTPYFSRDDDNFYIIDNPIMKEKVWKVPMVRPSAWKGAFFNAAMKRLKEKEGKDFADIYFMIYRIFGTGSEEFRKLSQWIQKENKEKFKRSLLLYALFELGKKINPQSDTIESLYNKILDEIGSKSFVPHKGRAIFYPTYFDRLSLEVINPHNRRTKAGTHPIYYEVVPKGTKGIFQLIYIPHDAILLKNGKVRKQAKDDADFLIELFKETLQETGIGAKTKLGWGKAEIKDEDIVCEFHDEEE